MATASNNFRRQVMAEFDSVPIEFHPLLLQLVRAYRKSVTLKPAAESFAQGCREARAGAVHPIRKLWEDTDAG